MSKRSTRNSKKSKDRKPAEYKLVTTDDIRDFASQQGITQVSPEVTERVNAYLEEVIRNVTDNTAIYLDARGKKTCKRQDAEMAVQMNPRIPPGSY